MYAFSNQLAIIVFPFTCFRPEGIFLGKKRIIAFDMYTFKGFNESYYGIVNVLLGRGSSHVFLASAKSSTRLS